MEHNYRTSAALEAHLKAQIRKEIEEGIIISRDPVNAVLPDLDVRTTTIYSLWYTRTCPECQHRFREEDQVRLCPRCAQAYHDDDQYNLHCWQRHFGGERICRLARYDPIAEAYQNGCDYSWPGKFPNAVKSAVRERLTQRLAGVTAQFLSGMSTVWKPYGEEQVIEIKPHSPIVGHKCPWCRFEARVGDRVIKCPCGKCDTYFHNDIFRHLTCWNGWNGAHGNDFCPTTGAKIARSISPTELESQ